MSRVILTCGRVTDQRQECVLDNAGAPAPARERSLVGPIVGGVAGGVLGSQVGRGSGRTAATAPRLRNRRSAAASSKPRAIWSGDIRSYTANNGRDITTTMPYNPGGTVRVAVGVIDGPPAGSPAPAAVMGPTTVREVSSTPPPPPPPAQGGYYYRY